MVTIIIIMNSNNEENDNNRKNNNNKKNCENMMASIGISICISINIRRMMIIGVE